MKILDIFLILTIHFIADFIFQKHEWAINKSKDNVALLWHTTTYSLCWIIPIFDRSNFKVAMLFCVITFIVHTITDYYTSRLNSYLWSKNRTHDFFVSVGFDQLLHYIQLILTYKLLL